MSERFTHTKEFMAGVAAGVAVGAAAKLADRKNRLALGLAKDVMLDKVKDEIQAYGVIDERIELFHKIVERYARYLYPNVTLREVRAGILERIQNRFNNADKEKRAPFAVIYLVAPHGSHGDHMVTHIALSDNGYEEETDNTIVVKGDTKAMNPGTLFFSRILRTTLVRQIKEVKPKENETPMEARRRKYYSKRNVDDNMKAWRAELEAVHRGESIEVYLEGGRSPDGSGILRVPADKLEAWLRVKASNIEFYPVSVDGPVETLRKGQKIPRRLKNRSVDIVVGEPIRIKELRPLFNVLNPNNDKTLRKRTSEAMLFFIALRIAEITPPTKRGKFGEVLEQAKYGAEYISDEQLAVFVNNFYINDPGFDFRKYIKGEVA